MLYSRLSSIVYMDTEDYCMDLNGFSCISVCLTSCLSHHFYFFTSQLSGNWGQKVKETNLGPAVSERRSTPTRPCL